MDIQKRFFSKVKKTPTCWLWTGALNQSGYGWFSRTRQLGPTRAHRVSYELHHGQIPKGLCVLHKCDNPPCVNPAHLYVGTQTQNALDRKNRDRIPKGISASWSKLTEEDVIAIRSSAEGQRAIAKRYGVCQQTISSVKRRINWKHI